MAVTPYKAVVPEDYTYLIVSSSQSKAFDGSTTSDGTLSEVTPIVIDASSFDGTYFAGRPSYNIVGEYSYSFLSASKTISIPSLYEGVIIRELNCKINVGNAVDGYYRYIRFIIKPNLTITNNININVNIHVNLVFSVMLHSIEYSITKRLTTLPIVFNGGRFNTSTYAFVFDTKTHSIMDYTDVGTNLWSSL